MAETCRQVLRDCGVNPERLALEWASAAEGPRFVELITEYVRKITAIGPLGEGAGEPAWDVVAKRLEAAVKAAQTPKVRMAFGTYAKKMHQGGSYTKDTITDGVSSKVFPQFRQERLSIEVRDCLSEGPKAISELVEVIGAGEEELFGILSSFEKKGLATNTDTGWAIKGE